jgi:hypothetical protein
MKKAEKKAEKQKKEGSLHAMAARSELAAFRSQSPRQEEAEAEAEAEAEEDEEEEAEEEGARRANYINKAKLSASSNF